ncbi:YjbH domain-containing protein [Marinobacter salinisoli]|uniref:YjbH domain-containing protein n=1 Tax=Marinobacter salinisoli TaxID=2769486 RepID=A0ABX7MQ91_9GAMM|nr:YjbH domain-containing protein [Marinobacter salinisoli]QSP94492.1 YjbH domain-containing protein [Marinobacter salinisoli]
MNFMTSKHWTLVGGAVACLKPAFVAGLVLHGQPVFATTLAFPGYSGYLNVPSATVLEHGKAAVQYSDQALETRATESLAGYGYYNNVSGLFGMFPNVEVGGRLTWDRTQANCYREDCGIRDLSANIKVQAPFIPQEWFTLAAGVQDLGGETDDFEALYVVAGRQFGPVTVSAGYGDPTLSDRYVDGPFGALSYRPTSWLNVMAEYDSQNVRLGLGGSTPRGLLPIGMQINGKVLAYDEGNIDNNRNFFSVGVSIPFGNETSKRHLQSVNKHATMASEPGYSPSNISSQVQPLTKPPAAVVDEALGGEAVDTPAVKDEAKERAKALGQQLIADGYDRVSVASRENVLHVQWENNIYTRDERDAIADVARRAQSAASHHRAAKLTLLNQNIPVVERTISLGGEGDRTQVRMLAADYTSGTVFHRNELQWDFQGGYGPSWKPRITLSPTVSSGIATEYGVWDASVGLSAETSVSLWPGALASVTYNAEVYATEDFEKGGVFYQDRQRTGFAEAEVQQTFKLHPQLYTSFHVGRYATDWNGVLNETLVLGAGGRHSLAYLGGSFEHADYDNVARDQMLARYSYYNPRLDTQVDIYGGQFFAEDTGVRIDSRFWFGDYALRLSYKNTDAEFVSLGWVIPLTPEKTGQFRYAQIRGDADWNYNIQTRINEDRNLTSFGGARVIESANPLRSVYLNRGRLALQ